MTIASLLQVIAQEANRTKIRVQDVFNTTLYTGTNSARTVTNGIDLATFGGFLWERYRNADQYHSFMDSKRGLTQYILPESPSAEGTDPNYIQSFNTNGYSLKTDSPIGTPVCSNSFRISPRFMDIVTYTGNGVARNIPHNLGTVPGLILVKKRNGGTAWRAFHRSLGAGNSIELNTSAVTAGGIANWNNTEPTTAVFSLGTDTAVNNNGDTYVAYVFAHDPTGIIQCGNYVGNGATAGPFINLGWEPQWLLVKRASTAGGNWAVLDTSRGLAVGSDKIITLNTMTVETTLDAIDPSSTGFSIKTADSGYNTNGATYIYMAIKS